MHELAIAGSIVAIAERHAAGRRVLRVEVEIGRLRQVVPAALEFAFELLSRGTALEGAKLYIEDVAAAGVCRACGERTELAGFPLACGACGGLDLELVRGEELRVDSLEVDEALTRTGALHDGD